MYIIIIALLCIFIVMIYKNRALPFHKNIPTPSSLPIIGNYLYINEFLDQPLEMILKFTQKFKKTWALRVPIERGALFIHDPKNVEYVLKSNFKNYIKGDEFHLRLVDLLGDGIFNSDGEKWRIQRKTASHLFTTRELRGYMTNTFIQHANIVNKKLLYYENNNEYIDLQSIFYQYTLDSICMIAFGCNLNTLGSENIHDDNDIKTPFTQEEALEFASLFDETQQLCERRFYKLGFKYQRWLSFILPFLFKSEVTIRCNVKKMNEIAYKIINDRHNSTDADLDTRDDLLSLFMKKKRHGGETFSDEYLRNVIMNFLIAGRDTTAQALSWCVYMLTQHPDCADKIYDEVIEHAGINGKIDFDVARQLEYTEAVVAETLRLYPSVPKDIKKSVNEDTLPDGTKVPSDVMIVYSPWTMGRLKELWGENATEFDPNRWLDNNVKRKLSTTETNLPGAQTQTTSPILRYSPYHFTAFQAGPRLCLGRSVAILEAKIMLAYLIRTYEITLKPNHIVTYRNSLTLPMKDGLLVKLKKRIIS